MNGGRIDEDERAVDRPGDVSPFALGLMMRRAHERAAGALAGAVRPLGLELRHFAVMIVLVDRGETNQRDLSGATGIDKAGIVRVVDDLERLGFATRRPVPGDRRVRLVAMTEAGRAAFDAAHVAARPIAADLVAHLGPGEAERMLDLLTRFTYPPSAPPQTRPASS